MRYPDPTAAPSTIDRLLREIPRALLGITSTIAAAPSFSMQQSNRWNGSTIQREASYLAASSGLPYITARGLRLRMVIGGQRDRAQRLLPHAVLVHEAVHPHREALRRRQHAVRHQVRPLAGDGVDAGGLAEAPVLALRQRAEHDHAVGQAGHDGRRRIGDRRAAAAATAAPLHGRGAQAVASRAPRPAATASLRSSL